MRSIRPGSDRDRLGLAADVADLRRGADELVVRHHRRELEVLVLLTDAALAEGYELLTLGQGAHRHGPLFEGNRHYSSRSDGGKASFAAPPTAQNGIGWPAKARHSRTAWPNLQICGS